MGALDNGSAGMGQVQDMEAATMGDEGFQQMVQPQVEIGRNDVEAMNKVGQIGGLQS